MNLNNKEKDINPNIPNHPKSVPEIPKPSFPRQIPVPPDAPDRTPLEVPPGHPDEIPIKDPIRPRKNPPKACLKICA